MTPSTDPFEMWSATHLLTMIVIALVTFFLLYHAGRQSAQNRLFFARRLGLVIALFFIYEYTWRICTYGLTACVEQQLLPLHFCAFMSIICIIALWWRARWASALVFFGVLSASIQAIITPALNENFPQVNFFNFFISHSLLLIAALTLPLVLGWRARLRDPLLAVLIMDLYVLLIHPVNLWLGSNYGYTTEGPAGTILAQLGPGPWYYLKLQLPALVLFFIMYLFVRPTSDKLSTPEE